MGLDVCAVTKYEIIKDPKVSEAEDLNRIYQPPGFEGHLGDQLNSGDYVNELECGDGDYHVGYIGHSWFREFLAELAGYEKLETPKPDYGDPDFTNKNYQHMFPYIQGMYSKEDLSLTDDFVAIIHFSDCEGVICHELCKVLDKSFDNYMETAKKSDWFGKYKDMAQCVKEAAISGGYLDFH